MFVAKNVAMTKIATNKHSQNQYFMSKKSLKIIKKDTINSEVRRKLGVSQEQLALILGISRAHVSLAELGTRFHGSGPSHLLANMYMEFYELETGSRSAYRSLETRLFMNEEYRKALPGMKTLEQDCRRRLNELKQELAALKQLARDTEHAIIVLTSSVSRLQEDGTALTKQQERQITGINLLKQKAYDRLLTCWEPEQAKLEAKIEALAGEARALRRYRLGVEKTHKPTRKK